MAAVAFPAFHSATAFTRDHFESKWEKNASSSNALTVPKEFAFLDPSSGISIKVVVASGEVPAWVTPTISAFIEIHSLQDNWDSYSGKRIDRDLIRQSLETLQEIMEFGSPVPSVVPLGDGGLQVEWHRKQQDLEIVFPADEAPTFYYRNSANKIEMQGFATDFVILARLLGNIA